MEENKNAYSEVIEILKYIDDEEKLEKLPMEMLEVLKSKVNPEYKPVISMDIPLEEQNLQPETYSILSWIAMKYWSDEGNLDYNNSVMEENAKIQEAIENREDEVQSIKDVVENVEEVTPNIEDVAQNLQENNYEKDTNSLLPIASHDLKWYEKIKIKIIEIFNKLLRKRKVKEERGNA